MILHPKTPSHFASRDKLLQSCLRPEKLPYSIAEEYPTVLNRHCSDRSLCFVDQGTKEVISHLNVLPRTLLYKGERIELAFVGNVASSPNHRQKGLVRKLVEHLIINASGRFKALILWSDLLEFYQRLGFVAVGKERRLTLDCTRLLAIKEELNFVRFIPQNEINKSLVKSMIRLRMNTPGEIQRSTREFLTLLNIPETYLLTTWQKKELTGYATFGRGYDFFLVAHEWGVRSQEDLVKLLAAYTRLTQCTQLTLLAPSHFSLEKRLYGFVRKNELWPMALARILDARVKPILEDSFIWGLDSI